MTRAEELHRQFADEMLKEPTKEGFLKLHSLTQDIFDLPTPEERSACVKDLPGGRFDIWWKWIQAEKETLGIL